MLIQRFDAEPLVLKNPLGRPAERVPDRPFTVLRSGASPCHQRRAVRPVCIFSRGLDRVAFVIVVVHQRLFRAYSTHTCQRVQILPLPRHYMRRELGRCAAPPRRGRR